MTHEERAWRVVQEFELFLGYEGAMGHIQRDRLSRFLQDALTEVANEDLSERRALRAQLAGIQTGQPIVFADKDRTQLRVWNPIRQQFAEFDGIHRTDGV